MTEATIFRLRCEVAEKVLRDFYAPWRVSFVELSSESAKVILTLESLSVELTMPVNLPPVDGDSQEEKP